MQKLDNLVLYVITVAPNGVIQRKNRLIDIINTLSETLEIDINRDKINESIINLKRRNKIKIQHIESITGDYKYTKYISTRQNSNHNIPNKDKIRTIVQRSCQDTKRRIV
jgi:hypothetical protein